MNKIIGLNNSNNYGYKYELIKHHKIAAASTEKYRSDLIGNLYHDPAYKIKNILLSIKLKGNRIQKKGANFNYG